MPIYEYECKACGNRQEAIQKMSDDPLVECAECSKPDLKKLISATSFRLKGGGWYETDFKGSNKKSDSSTVTKESSSSDSKPTSKSSSGSSGGSHGNGSCGCH